MPVIRRLSTRKDGAKNGFRKSNGGLKPPPIAFTISLQPKLDYSSYTSFKRIDQPFFQLRFLEPESEW